MIEFHSLHCWLPFIITSISILNIFLQFIIIIIIIIIVLIITMMTLTTATATCTTTIQQQLLFNLCLSLTQELERYAIHAHNLILQRFSTIDGIGYGINGLLVHLGHVNDQALGTRESTIAVLTFEVFGPLVLYQHFVVVKVTVAVEAPWATEFVVELLGLFLLFSTHSSLLVVCLGNSSRVGG